MSSTSNPTAPTHVTPLPPSTLATFQPNLFEGRVLICTGGGIGVGKGITAAMMRHGANAVIIGRKIETLEPVAAELSKSTGKTCLAIAADICDSNEMKSVVQKTIEKFGRIDYVVCSAAINFISPIRSSPPEEFQKVLATSTIGAFNTIQATLPHVRATRGSYLHISATNYYKGQPLMAHSNAAKAAIDAISRTLAVEEGPHGVRSNVIAPGVIYDTVSIQGLVTMRPEFAAVARRVPLQRFSVSDDSVQAAMFLLSPAAAIITGQILVVDGGEALGTIDIFPYPDAVIGFGAPSA